MRLTPYLYVLLEHWLAMLLACLPMLVLPRPSTLVCLWALTRPALELVALCMHSRVWSPAKKESERVNMHRSCAEHDTHSDCHP